MNVSELIIHLQELEVIHGDLEVVLIDDEYPNGIDGVSVIYINTPWYKGDVIQIA